MHEFLPERWPPAAYIAGHTLSNNFPVTQGAYQVANKATVAGHPDSGNAFIAEFGIGSGLPLIPTTTAVVASVNPQVAGANVAFKATVSNLVDRISTGNVTFKVDGIVKSIVPLNSSGQASYSTAALTSGTHMIAADYSGDTVFAPSNASLSEKINANSVTATFSTSPAGLSYSVDGTTYSTSKTLTLVAGSAHTIATNSPQSSAGTKHTFTSWSDGGALSHTIMVNTSGAYTAAFNTDYLLTTTATPSSGGAVTPASGTYFTAGTSVPLTATPNSGYAFKTWTGSVASTTSAHTTITMNAPETVTASFVSSGAVSLFGNITAKSGAGAARLWNIQVSNNGPGAALAAEVSAITFTQVGGTACAPSVTTVLPASTGNLAPGASVTVPVTIDFNGCAANSRFTVTVSLAANAGNSSGSIVRLNQFQ